MKKIKIKDLTFPDLLFHTALLICHAYCQNFRNLEPCVLWHMYSLLTLRNVENCVYFNIAYYPFLW